MPLTDSGRCCPTWLDCGTSSCGPVAIAIIGTLSHQLIHAAGARKHYADFRADARALLFKLEISILTSQYAET